MLNTDTQFLAYIFNEFNCGYTSVAMGREKLSF